VGRVCGLYQRPEGEGRRPGVTFIATSATIANPAEHFALLTGLQAAVITDDGSPHGPRAFALWNPPFLDRSHIARRSANHEARDLLTALVSAGVRAIAFTRARVIAYAAAQGLETVEARASLDEVLKAEAMVLSNSLIGLRPVSVLGDHGFTGADFAARLQGALAA
jgi:ATP-dependent helicase YprA (DUF1998 family)